MQGIVGFGCGGMVSEELKKTEKKKSPLPQAPPLPEQAEAKGHNLYKKLFGPGEKVEPVPLVPKQGDGSTGFIHVGQATKSPHHARFPSQANRP